MHSTEKTALSRRALQERDPSAERPRGGHEPGSAGNTNEVRVLRAEARRGQREAGPAQAATCR